MINLKRFKQPWFRITILFICLFLLRIDLPSQTGGANYRSMFNWAKRYFFEGKLQEAREELEILLTFLPIEKIEQAGVGAHRKSARLAGEIWLLLGAVNEISGRRRDARKFYDKARTISGQFETLELAAVEIPDLDLTRLPLGQRHFLGKKDVDPNAVKRNTGLGLIQKEARKVKKKKKLTVLWIVAGLAVAAGLAIVLLGKKKKKETSDPDYDVNELGINWVFVQGGAFIMGSDSAQAEPDEQPVHQVNLSSYYISKYEITFNQWQKYLDDVGQAALPSDEGWGRGNRPIINITYNNARDFCHWLSAKTGKNIRIPSEAQWERAAYGSDAADMLPTLYPWGDQEHNCNLANWCCHTSTMPVGSFSGGNSYLGLGDMAGNVSEWCSDWYSETYYSVSETDDPRGPSPDSDGTEFSHYKVVRGGSYDCDSQPGIRISDRDKRYGPSPANITWYYSDVGFRVVLIPD